MARNFLRETFHIVNLTFRINLNRAFLTHYRLCLISINIFENCRVYIASASERLKPKAMNMMKKKGKNNDAQCVHNRKGWTVWLTMSVLSFHGTCEWRSLKANGQWRYCNLDKIGKKKTRSLSSLFNSRGVKRNTHFHFIGRQLSTFLTFSRLPKLYRLLQVKEIRNARQKLIKIFLSLSNQYNQTN